MIKVKDLKDQIGKPFPRPMLFCVGCGGEYSANAGDYFMHSPDHVLECCGVPLRLMKKVVSYQEI